MALWNGKTKLTAKLTEAKLGAKKEDTWEDEEDLLYVLEKKVNTILVDKDREIAALKAEIHNNTQFMHQVIMELINRVPATGTAATRSTYVPVKRDEKMKESDGSIVGPVGKLP